MTEMTVFPADLPIGELAPIQIGQYPGTIERVANVPEGLPDVDPRALGGSFGRFVCMIGAVRVYLPNFREVFPSYIQAHWNGQPAFYRITCTMR